MTDFEPRHFNKVPGKTIVMLSDPIMELVLEEYTTQNPCMLHHYRLENARHFSMSHIIGLLADHIERLKDKLEEAEDNLDECRGNASHNIMDD